MSPAADCRAKVSSDPAVSVYIFQDNQGFDRLRRGMDEDLVTMTREQLIEEVRKLREGIRTHRDSTGHDLCWYHPALWGLLPEKQDPLPTVPEWPQFMEGCIRFPKSLDRQLPDAPRSNLSFKR